MSALEFAKNDYPTVGIEIELQLVDAETLELKSAIDQVLRELPDALIDQVKPELMQCYLEVNTGICRTVKQAEEDLRGKLELLEEVTGALGLQLCWGATHPFSSWRDQQITVNDRYYRLVDLMQDVARRLVTFGLHVHVGVDTGDKAIMVCDRMLRYLPLLLALSSNSPFWEGRCTGLHSNRSIIMQQLPTAGLPHQMRNWSEYVWLINHLVATGFINTVREIWWDIRPHHNFGTVEIRICDMPRSLWHVSALAALVQCLVKSISDEIDGGTFLTEYHPMMVQQNKWRATRYGAGARLVGSPEYQQRSVQEAIDRQVERLLPWAKLLDCEHELMLCRLLPGRTGAERQLEIFQETACRKRVVEQLLAENDWHSAGPPHPLG
jgi:glutamate---cysteine ligase / carboxylate-amine ligase